MKILGVGVDNVSMQEALQKLEKLITSGRLHNYIVTPNPEFIVAAQKDPDFKNILNAADLSIPDGIGLLAASHLLSGSIKGRVTGVDFVTLSCALAAERGWEVFFLGAAPSVAERAASKLKDKYPHLKIAGTYAGDGSSRGDKDTKEAVSQAAEEEKPIDLLFVAYGHGKQEKWIARNLSDLPVAVAVGVGGAFDFIAGEVPRAPRFFRLLGLEWLFRLIVQPGRIKRIYRAVVVFPWLVLKKQLVGSRK
ncbi:MAG: WecB/TagA/CpsF family glycosyltransferase [Patescibacteria group bacterium]